MDAAKTVKDYLMQINRMSNTGYYAWQADRAVEVPIVAPPFKPRHAIRMKECYRNASLAAIERKHMLVFGYILSDKIPLPIEHAWNFDPGISAYYDVTHDYILAPRLEDERFYHVQIAIMSPEKALDIILEHKVWDNFLHQIYSEENEW